MRNITYFFYGFGSEYVLHPLYEEMVAKGYNCIEIDALKILDSKKHVKHLQGKRIVFITSAHLLLDQTNFTNFYETSSVFYSPLEIIRLLKPVKSIFIPHDLSQPFIKYGEDYLNQFDMFFSPCEPFTTVYSQYTHVEEVGWIKYSDKHTPSQLRKPVNKAIWFLSDYVLHLKMGVEKSYETISPILLQGCSIKFPLWERSDEFEDYYKERGVDVYRASENSVDLIHEHEIILTNGLSSIVAESYLSGKTTVNIMEGSHYGDEKDRTFAFFPSVQYVESIVDFRLSKVTKTHQKKRLIPFNMTKAIKLITA